MVVVKVAILVEDTSLNRTPVEQVVKDNTLKKLRVFDFDDTLAKTHGKVKVSKENGIVLTLTAGEYAVYVKDPGDTFDYTEFETLVKPAEIAWMTTILRRVVQKRGPDGAVILTARGTTEPIKQFFKIFGLPDIPIVAIGNGHPDNKAQWILYVAMKHDYDVIEFFDDSLKNVEAVKNIASKVPDVKVITHHVQHRDHQVVRRRRKLRVSSQA